MDVSKYHTKFPPREHEEAVRMLLEGLDKQVPQTDLTEATVSQAASRRNARSQPAQPQESRSRPRQQEPSVAMRASKPAPPVMALNQTPSSSSIDSGSLARGPIDEDDDDVDEEFVSSPRMARNRFAGSNKENDNLEFNSEESSSQEFSIQVSPQISSKRNHAARPNKRPDSPEFARVLVPKMQSKATSTASDSVSTSGASSGGANHQADLAASDDMNGNYEAIPSRTIAIQCDLKLSSVKRDGYLDSASTDLASMQASSISSTRYGFYKLSPETLEQRRQLARSVSSRNIAHQNEEAPVDAPTSMSELSSNAEEEEEADQIRDQEQVGGRRKLSVPEPSFEPSIASGDIDLARNKRDQRFFSQHQEERKSASRRRQDSLPRRPKTALSYVSTSRLRDDARSNRNSDDELVHDSESRDDRSSLAYRRRMMARDRAMSQQVLSTTSQRDSGAEVVQRLAPKGNLRHQEDALSHSSNSDSEIHAERYRLPQQEEIVISAKRNRATMGASPQVRRSNNIRDGPLFRRSATLTSAGNAPLKSALTRTDYRESADEKQFGKKDGRSNIDQEEIPPVIESDQDVLAAARRQQRLRESLVRKSNALNNYPTTDEDNQLTAAERRRMRAALLEQQQPKARFSSMSLSRKPLMDHHQEARGSCNPPPANQARRQTPAGPANTVTNYPTDGPGYEPSSQANNQAQERHLRSTLTRTSKTPLATSQRPPQIGRSTSMKQSRSRLASAAGAYDHLAQPVYTVPNGGQPPTSRQQRYYDSSAHCEYDDCCGAMMVPGEELVSNNHLGQAQRVTRLPNGNIGPMQTVKRSESEDSESPVTRTWANPSLARRPKSSANNHSYHQSTYNLNNHGEILDSNNEYRRPSEVTTTTNGTRPLTRKSARSHSMRDVNQQGDTNPMLAGVGANQRPRRFETIYRAGQQQLDEEATLRQDEEAPSEEFSVCSASSMNGTSQETLTRAQAQHQPLDFDSQQRLNEIGLPEPGHPMSHTKQSSASHLGLPTGLPSVANRYATTGRTSASQQHPTAYHQNSFPAGGISGGSALITGRAMSQQSLTRPTMPLSRRLRRSGGGSGSDVGGSSMSLVSRLRDGSRYENAHTRNPVVMLIPQATPSRSGAEGGPRRASSRLGRTVSKSSGSRVSSQDRSRRSGTSRNGSDSESSSSMLRTLVKPRVSRMGSTNRSTRRRPLIGTGRNDSDLEENMDDLGQLATEIDSYKFRRRYSVPKDAKINWFSKLKQRVTSKG